MYPFKRLLIPTDFSVCAEGAYRQGLRLAQGYGAEVHVLHVAPPGRSSHRRHLERWLDRASVGGVHDLHASGKTWRPLKIRRMLTQHADPAQAILHYAETHQIDLISIGTHGDNLAHRYLSRGGRLNLLGQTAGQVVRHADVPVLTVVQRLARTPESIHTILVPFDYSPLSVLALTQARDLAALHDAHLDVLHVTSSEPATNGHAQTNGHANDKGTQPPAATTRADLIAAYDNTPGATVSVDFHLATGIPHREIQGAIQERSPDLVLIGAYAEQGQDLLGEVADRVVRSSPCSVLTVRGAPATSGATLSDLSPTRRMTFPGRKAVS
jgi:nucleotide-binding universal stress UspA family protein